MGWGTEILIDDRWGAFRYSDKALEQLVFEGCAQHRIQRVKSNDTHAPAGAYYAVYSSMLSELETKDGFEPLGADAYFNSKGNVIGIWRKDSLYTPDMPLGSSNDCSSAGGRLRWCTNDWEDGWLHAKLAFRGSVMALITLVDHLQGIHILVSNSMNIASEHRLPTWHPLRRLLAPFTYHSFGVNYAAGTLLVNEEGMIPHATGLTDRGIRQVFEYGNRSSQHLTWLSIPERKALKQVDTLTLPLDEDGSDYYQIIFDYVKQYLAHYYGAFEATIGARPEAPAGRDACASDFATAYWYARIDEITPNKDLPKPLSCQHLLEVLSTSIYLGSAIHRHVGTIAAEVEDPCFAPWAWRRGELCGPPRTFLAHALVMSATAYKSLPKIVEDYTHLFEHDTAKQMWLEFTANLTAFEEVINKRNDARLAAGKLAFKVFEPSNIETAVGI